LLFLVKALATHNAGHEVDLFALSNNVQAVCGAEILCPEKSTLLGPGLVIHQEYPNIRTKSIDLDLSGDASQYESAADLVLGEFLDSDSNLFVAYRNAQRWVQTYERVTLRTSRHQRPSFREGGVYLITGGLGNVGSAISEYLARRYQARLVLVGRSASSARIGMIDRLEALGAEVLHLNANVADRTAMRGVIEQTYQRFGALHGVIHGAGIVGNNGYREIKDCDQQYCDTHFQAKAKGVCVLEEVLAGRPLDFCLLLSSLASVLGGVGQAAYAAANIYMDSFVRRRRRISSVPWLAVNWDIWRVEGNKAADSVVGKTLQELGMSATEATEMMEVVLGIGSASQLVVSTGDLGARIDQWIKLESLNAPQVSGRPSPSGSFVSRPRGFQAADEGPRDENEQQVARIWQNALGIERIGIHESFAELGGHSLLAIKIVSEVRRAFQIDLTVRALFDAPTIAKLSNYVKEQLIADIEELSDEEARQLVSIE